VAGTSVCLPTIADRYRNRALTPPPYQADPDAQRLHEGLLIADLHADSLLWNRDPLKRHGYGHVDLPRLQEAGVELQVFSVVTKVPYGADLDENPGDSDMLTLLTVLQGRPPRTWSSLLERALYQGEQLKAAVRASAGALKLITTQRELEELLSAQRRGEPVIGALLALEGAHALEGELAHLDQLYAQGYRMVGLTHHFDNTVAGSAQGIEKGGLTALGRQVIRRAQDHGMVIDLAHASPRAIDDVLAMATKPVIASHTGVRGTCDTVRNLSDRHVQGIAATGGVIGIGLFEWAVCGDGVEDTVKAMRYAADLVGVEHIALGSDFDGATTTFVDVTGLVLLTQAMLEAGFSQQEIAAILGGNVLRVLRQTLPDTQPVVKNKVFQQPTKSGRALPIRDAKPDIHSPALTRRFSQTNPL